MSYTRTETMTINIDTFMDKKKVKNKPKSHGLFHTKTAPGAPGSNPPDHAETTNDDCCGCFSLKIIK